MDESSLLALLERFRNLPAETEWLEFKEAKKDYQFEKIGQYFSAISNEANMKGMSEGWLVFGIHDRTKDVVDTQYRIERQKLDQLKYEVALHTSNRITFTEIHELWVDGKRVVMFQIPAAPQGVPIAWKGHYYGRDGESLGALNLSEIERIRKQSSHEDWSAHICPDATLADLDEQAIQKARAEFKTKNPRLAEEVDDWDNLMFLNKAKITMQGKITNTALILLGRPESEHFLSPSIAKMSWILKDEHNIEKDYEHFGPPFLLHTNELFSKIRNLKYRYIQDQSLFPVETTQYDSYVIREALHNCIAHQDYELYGKINVVESPDELIFTNMGSFIPDTIENVILQDAPQEFYRNRWLAEAMVNLNMIDTIGSGIKKMFIVQRNRHFPLPDYDLTSADRVKVTITGKIIDENYTRLLIKYTDLDLETVISLDKVQKKKTISKEESKRLRNKKLVEGRYPNLYPTAEIAALTGDKSVYIKNRAFDNEHYKQMILSFIREYGSATRADIDHLLLDKLSDALDEGQKRKKISNLLYEMHKKEQTIVNKGSNKYPSWTSISHN